MNPPDYNVIIKCNWLGLSEAREFPFVPKKLPSTTLILSV